MPAVTDMRMLASYPREARHTSARLDVHAVFSHEVRPKRAAELCSPSILVARNKLWNDAAGEARGTLPPMVALSICEYARAS